MKKTTTLILLGILTSSVILPSYVSAASIDTQVTSINSQIDSGNSDSSNIGDTDNRSSTENINGLENTNSTNNKENKQSITGSDFSMILGDKKPTVSDFKASATDKDGNPLDVTADFSQVDFSKAGIYDVVLNTTDGQSKTVKLTIKENNDKKVTPNILSKTEDTKINNDKITKDESISSIDSEDINEWMPDKNVQKIVMETLGLQQPSQITKNLVTQLKSFEANNNSFTSFDGLQYAKNLQSFSLTNCKLPNQFQLSFFSENNPMLTLLRLNNCDLTSDNLKGDITFHYITTLDLSNNKITGEISDFTQIIDLMGGDESFDISNNLLSGGLPINFPDGIPGVVAKDSTIKEDSEWFPQDNFISAQDLLGNNVSFNNIIVSGEVNTKVPGIYKVTYTQNYNNSWKNYNSITVNVNVTSSKTINGSDFIMTLGDKEPTVSDFKA
ncbi:bacterial Ig-like domain-containing protein, partial [Lactococcus lactis]|uniref:bacterial Ig-like domain-containing protein n=1 Tax=Lactococcus lactis TaxID=1358 RepID=UPI00071D5936